MLGPGPPGRRRTLAPVIPDDVRGAVEAADTDTLLRVIDGMCAAREWDRLLELADLCAEAATRGRQVWGVGEHIRYRLALEAPAPLAAGALAGDPTRFTLGPLTEVVATTHPWSELDPHLPPGPDRDIVAHERAIRGDTIPESAAGPTLELPTTLASWEPAYQLAVYRSDRAEFPAPPRPGFVRMPAGRTASEVDDGDAVEALLALVSPWQDESTGRVRAIAVDGSGIDAAAALVTGDLLWAPVGPAEALAWMGWAGASGGLHGRRRGAAQGRFGAWWAATALAGLEWPPDPGELGERLGDLEWGLWGREGDVGWTLRLAASDPAERIAWAIDAVDADG